CRPRRVLASTRAARDERVGRVGRRGRGSMSARRTSSARRSQASARLRSCVRWLRATMRTAPSCVSLRPARARKRLFTGSSREVVAARSKRSCTAEETLLTFWPPGPEPRTNESSTSASAMARLGVTKMGMGLQRGVIAASRTALCSSSLSGVQVRNQLAFEACDLVLEGQLALLQAFQLQLVDMQIERESRDDLVEVAVLDAQVAQFLHAPEKLAVDVVFGVRHSCEEESRPRPRFTRRS